MAISRIYVRRHGGALDKAAITTSPELRSSAGVYINVAGATAAVAMPKVLSLSSMLNYAYAELLKERYISSINGAAPDDKGNMWILPADLCTDVAGIALDGLSLHDLCVPCNSCNEYAKIKAYYETLRINLNSLKDVNLYDNEIAKTRRERLLQGRLDSTVSTAMSHCTFEDEYDRLISINSIQLLKQYVALVHMWNWLAFSGRESTSIQETMQGTLRFAQVKADLDITSCDIDNVTCTIEITAQDVSSQALLTYGSVYAEPLSAAFATLNDDASKDVTTSSDIEHTDALTKKITTSFSGMTTAGTCSVRVLFCPFFYADKDDAVPATTSETIEDVVVGDKTVSKVYTWKHYAHAGHIPLRQLVAATRVDIENCAQVEVVGTDPGSTIWRIDITWTTTTAPADTDAEPTNHTTVSTFFYDMKNPQEPAVKTASEASNNARASIVGVKIE